MATTAAPAIPRRRKARRATPTRAWPAWLRHPAAEVGLVLALCALAAAARWPYLMRLPKFTDETVEVRWVFPIVAGEQFPLTAFDPYYGPIHAYILAAALKLFGYHMILPRLVSLVFGVLTVGTTYLLGRELAGRWAGALGAALLLTSPQHILINSHIAWENCTTPFYTTLCCWALARYANAEHGTRGAEPGPGRRGRWTGAGWMALCGFLFGLAVQSHPGAIVLGPGLALAYLWHAWRIARGTGQHSPATSSRPIRHSPFVIRHSFPALLAALAALVAYSPVLIYNLTNDLAAVGKVASSRNYAYEANATWASYARNLRELVYALLRQISDPFRIPGNLVGYLTSPYLVLMGALCVAGIALLARRGQPLPLCTLIGTLVVMPRFNRAYGGAGADQIGDRYLLSGRYLTYFLPLADIAIAAVVLALIALAWRALPRRWRDPALALPAVLLPLLILYPLLPLRQYYADESARDPSTASFMATVAAIDAARGPRTPVWLDRQFEKILLNDGSQALDVLDYLLILDRVPHQIVDDPAEELRRVAPTLDPADRESHPIVVMSRDRCWPLRGQVAMERISDTLLLNELFRYFAVYRWAPPPAAGECQPPPR